MQFTQIKDSESSLKTISHGVPQGSVLGQLLFIIFINDMHNSIEHSKMHHYADDTNLLLTDNSLKKINKYVNHDLSLLCHWLRANKLNFRISAQKIDICNKVQYLGVVLEENLELNGILT